jgi:DNA polymerase-3 subunit delta'
VRTAFGGLLHQEGAANLLRSSLSSGRVAGAYLFVGPRGVGRYTAALAFAAALNCETAGDEPCGMCRSCRDVASGSHPDVGVWRWDPERKTSKIDRIRELEASLSLRPYQGRWKVAILNEEAETMSWESANAFLLTLEEPPPHSVIILKTANIHDSIPPTVVSRCQRIFFRPLPDEAVAGMLVASGVADPEAARVAACLAEGGMTAAADRLGEEGRATMDTALAVIEAVRRRGPGAAVTPGLSLPTGAVETQRLISALASLVRLSLRVRLGLAGLPGEARLDEVVGELARRIDEKGYRTALDLFRQTGDLIRGNINPRLALEGLLFGLSPLLEESGAE